MPWRSEHNKAFETLKNQLCVCAENALQIVDFNKPWNLQVDASDYAISGVLTQPADNGPEIPVAFISHKLSGAQKNWSVIEKEACAAIWALNKFRNWIYGKPVTVFTDHNPLTYLTDCIPKSSKLTRCSLALAEHATFKNKAGKLNVAADCLSRVETGSDDEQGSSP